MNKVVLIGRLVADPELRTTQTGKSVASFRLAVNRRFKQDGQPTADFFNIVAWGRPAEVICQYLCKGSQIGVNGRLQSRSYDAQDGSKRYVTEVVLEEFDFIGGRNDGGVSNLGGSSGGNYQSSQPPAQVKVTGTGDFDFDEDFHMMVNDDDVPF